VIDSKHGEEETRQETEAGQVGGEAVALQRGPKESVGGEEVTEEMTNAGRKSLIYAHDPETKISDLSFEDFRDVYISMRQLSKAQNQNQ